MSKQLWTFNRARCWMYKLKERTLSNLKGWTKQGVRKRKWTMASRCKDSKSNTRRSVNTIKKNVFKTLTPPLSGRHLKQLPVTTEDIAAKVPPAVLGRYRWSRPRQRNIITLTVSPPHPQAEIHKGLGSFLWKLCRTFGSRNAGKKRWDKHHTIYLQT